MNAYIFENVEQLTSNYHSGGGLIIFARDIDHATELTRSDSSISISDVEWSEAKVFKMADDVQPQIFKFPDAGCC